MKLLDIFVSNDSEKLLKLLPVLFSTILQCKQIMPERQNLQPLTPSKATTLRLTTFWLGPLSQALACLIFQQKPTKSWSGVVQASWGIFRKRFNQETRWSVSFTAIFPHLVLGGYKMKKSRTSTSTVHLPTTVILWTALNNPSITTTREQRRSTWIWDKTLSLSLSCPFAELGDAIALNLHRNPMVKMVCNSIYSTPNSGEAS